MLQRKNVLDETEENPGIDDLLSFPVWVDNTSLAGDSDISIQIEELFPRKILIVAVWFFILFDNGILFWRADLRSESALN